MPAKDSDSMLPRPITIQDFSRMTIRSTNQHGVFAFPQPLMPKQTFTTFPMQIRRMSERRSIQRILPPITHSVQRRDNKESPVKVKPDAPPGQSIATSSPIGGSGLADSQNSSVGQRSLFQRKGSLPESLLSECYQSCTSTKTAENAEHQRQKTHAHNSNFPSLPFRFSIASEYDLTPSKGLEERNQSNTEFFTSKKLGFNIKSSGGNSKESNMLKRGSYSRGQFMAGGTDVSHRKPREELSPRSLYEMQLRYKNLIKQNRHINFKNSQVLRGEKIRKPHTLPGIRAPVHSDIVSAGITGNLELLAVLSVKRANETEKETRSDKQRLPSTDSEESGSLARIQFPFQEDGESQEALDRRSRFYVNCQKLNKRKAMSEKRQRREAYKDDNERMLITQALQLASTQCARSKPIMKELKGTQVASLPKVDGDIPRPSGRVTISGGCGQPIHKSIEITLPDCNLTQSTADCAQNHNDFGCDDFNANKGIFKLDSNEEDSIPAYESKSLVHVAQTLEPENARGEQVPDVTGHSNELLMAQEADVFTDDSFSEVLFDPEEEPQVSDVDVLSDNDEYADDEEVHRALGAVAVDITLPDRFSRSTGSPSSIEASCRGSRPISSHSVNLRDFLAVPVTTVARCVEVLSLGSMGGSGAIDIPEIRMICATPLPPGSPE